MHHIVVWFRADEKDVHRQVALPTRRGCAQAANGEGAAPSKPSVAFTRERGSCRSSQGSAQWSKAATRGRVAAEPAPPLDASRGSRAAALAEPG